MKTLNWTLALLLLNFAHAEDLDIKVERIEVEKTKANGLPWDPAGDPPDIFGAIKFGVFAGRCRTTATSKVSLQRNRYVTQGADTVLRVGLTDPICYTAKLQDKDAIAHDLVGKGKGVLLAGSTNTVKVGRATLTIVVGGAAPDVPKAVVELPPRPDKRNAPMLLTITGADIAPRRPDGTSWDEPHDQAAVDEAELMYLAELGVGVAMTAATGGAGLGLLGQVVKGPGAPRLTHTAKTASAPDPVVQLQLRGTEYAGPVDLDTFAPKWSMTLLVDAEHDRDAIITIAVLDRDGRSQTPIGSDSFKVSKLIDDGIAKLSFGAVQRLTITAEKVTEQPGSSRSFRLEPGKHWVDTGMHVHAGQVVRITATGKHCFASGCFDADGDTSRQLRGGQPGQAPIQFGQLAATIGDAIEGIGRGRQFVARSSGPLRIGTASGEAPRDSVMEATVEVFFPIKR